jgi:hypothetical protein
MWRQKEPVKSANLSDILPSGLNFWLTLNALYPTLPGFIPTAM